MAAGTLCVQLVAEGQRDGVGLVPFFQDSLPFPARDRLFHNVGSPEQLHARLRQCPSSILGLLASKDTVLGLVWKIVGATC